MKKAYLATAVVAALFLGACGSDNANDSSDAVDTQSAIALDTDAQKQSYALGANMGMFVEQNFERQQELGLEVDKAALEAGFQDALAGNSRFSEEEIAQLNASSEAAFRAAMQAKAEQDASANIEAGKAFLAENATREEVTVTDSGLQYEVLEVGDGASPAATDTVTVHYKGTLLDGSEFDSSYSRGEPTSFPLNRVIPGWTEGLQLMQVGAKYRFYIPSELAYGQRATGKITPNSTLIFDVELLDIAGANEE